MKFVKLLVDKYRLRLEIIQQPEFDHMLPLKISLEFNQLECLKYMWECTPWYFEEISLIRNIVIEVITYAHYRFTSNKDSDKTSEKTVRALKDSKDLIKYFLKSPTLISYFEFMHFDDKICFVKDVLSFRNYVIQDEISKNFNGRDSNNVSMSEMLKDYRHSYIGGDKTTSDSPL